jgi:hypothetical protein
MRRILLLAVVLGVGLGAVAAVAIPKERERPGQALRVAAERPPPPGGLELRAVPGSVRQELRADDPDGGPAWALRTYRARYAPARGVPRRFHSVRPFCVQAGRIVDGRFGWIDGSRTFRPAGYDFRDAPTGCAPGVPGAGRRAIFKAITLADEVDTPEGRLTRTIAFGAGGRGTSGVELTVAGRSERPRTSRGGGFLAFASAGVRPGDLRVRVRYGRGRGQTLGPQDGPGFSFGNARELGGTARRPLRDYGRPEVEARAPDPHGGLPWAIGAVPNPRGGYCLTQPGRGFGNRVGQVDFDLGTFDDEQGNRFGLFNCTPKRAAKNAVDTAFLLGGDTAPQMPGSDPERGRIARRTLRGVTVVYGRAREDVTAVTIATPRDVRTLVPSSRAHAFVAAYDGGFEAGEITITAHFRDGTSRQVDRFSLGGI